MIISFNYILIYVPSTDNYNKDKSSKDDYMTVKSTLKDFSQLNT